MGFPNQQKSWLGPVGGVCGGGGGEPQTKATTHKQVVWNVPESRGIKAKAWNKLPLLLWVIMEQIAFIAFGYFRI